MLGLPAFIAACLMLSLFLFISFYSEYTSGITLAPVLVPPVHPEPVIDAVPPPLQHPPPPRALLKPLLPGCRYGELQQPHVSSHMAAIQIPDAQSEEADAVVSALQKAVAQAMQVSIGECLHTGASLLVCLEQACTVQSA